MAIWPIVRTRLGIWNHALGHLSEPRLVTETDDIHSRYVIEAAWEGCARFVIGDAYWNFFMKAVALTPDNLIDHVQYSHDYAKPSDWIKTFMISDTFDFRYEADFSDESGVWYSDYPRLYVRYMSTDNANDVNITNWPEEFVKALSYYLAFFVANEIERSNAERESLMQLYKQSLTEAKNRDAVNQANLRLRNDRNSWRAAMTRRGAGRGDIQIQTTVDTSTGTIPIGDA